MTENEAIKVIEKNRPTSGYAMLNEALDMAINSLEKRIPKKPTYDGDDYSPDGSVVWDEWLCPNCRSRYEVDYDDYDYCPNCGQSIDWSE